MVAVRDIHLKDNFTLDEWVSSLTLSESDKNQLRTVYQYCLTLGDEALTNRLLVRGVEMVGILLMLSMDLATLKAAILYPFVEAGLISQEKVNEDFGPKIAKLVEGVLEMEAIRSLQTLHRSETSPEQVDNVRRMLLAMVEDVRAVVIKLAERIACLREAKKADEETRVLMAQEITNIYAPLANRLGIGQLKWELEDLAFRYLHPDTYKQIAKQLDEKRLDRERYIREFVQSLRDALAEAGVEAEVYGRPKHIYSIWRKMQKKHLEFNELFDVRAVRVITKRLQDCYAALGIVHTHFHHIPREFDDYVANPKPNGYQSIHTVVVGEEGKTVEIQIRTEQMHQDAELGVAAHWRYKEGARQGGDYDEKIALLRNLLSWRDEVTDAAHWVEQLKRASLDDTLYVLTPQGRVVDLPRGATPIDFAYRLHTDVGHHCRGAKVDGHLVPLNTPLESGQTVEIVTAKEGGPSRDWLDVRQGYVATSRARSKIKQYFAQLDEEEILSRGRNFVTKEMQRDGHGQANIDGLADRLGFKNAEALYLAAGRGEVGPRAMQTALREGNAPEPAAEAEPEFVVSRSRSRSGDNQDKILIDGVGKLMTSLSRCCKPAPPDAIEGFVTRGRGISIHRVDCADFQDLARKHPERVIPAEWGEKAHDTRNALYQVDINVQASDRQGLLRDISEVLSREKLNVIAVNTLTKKGTAYMRFTMEVGGIKQVQRAITLVREVPGVIDAQRK